MSGGRFDYKQYTLNDISDQIKHYIKKNNTTDEYGDTFKLSKKSIKQKFMFTKLIIS